MRKPFTRNRTSQTTQPRQLTLSNKCDPLETAVGEGQYMLLVIDPTTRHTDENILKYKLESLE
jgi:hypothetical protein